MASRMKSWHIIVMDGWKIVRDIEKFDVKEARELEKQLKEQYAETNPTFKVTREWY